MKVAIGIPTYAGSQRLDYLLQSIHMWTTLPEIPPVAVLDDGSPTLEARRIEKVCQKWKVEWLQHPENMGIAKSWNDLTRHFDSDIMVLINDDIIVALEWLKSLIYFLGNNECGSVSLGNYFALPEDIPKILKGIDVTPRDPFTRQPNPELRNVIREEQSPGLLMCPSGSLFAFKREKFELVDGFDDKSFKSFNEESDFGTKLAQLGYASYGLTHPNDCWHVWSQTFRENPELEAEKTMRESRIAYCDKWDVPEKYWDNPFDYTNPKFMSKIPPQEITWLGKNGKIYEAWDKK